MAAPVITDYRDDFSDVWPAVERRLRGRLARRGLSRDALDDVLQETAVAALSRQVPFRTEDELLAWATVVAKRLAVADHRRRSRLSVVDEVPEGATRGADDAALARVALGQTLAAVPALSDDDRAALAPVDMAALARRDAVRMNVRRHRARARLRALSSAAWGIAVAAAVGMRLRPSRRATVLVAGATSVTILLLPFSGNGHDSHRPTPEPGPSATHLHPEARTGDREPRADSLQVQAATAAVLDRTTADTAPPAPQERPVLPEAMLEITTPNGDEARVDGEGGQPAELSICIALGSPNETCLVTAPIPSTPLDDLKLPI